MTTLFVCAKLMVVIVSLLFYVLLSEHSFHRYWNSTFNMIYWYQKQKGNKNSLQSSQQWYILDEYLRFDKKKCLPCSKTVALKLNYFYWKQKVINLLAGTITFLLYWHLFQAYILLHRKLRLEQIMPRNSTLSLAKSPFWNNGTIYHLCKLGLYSQIGEQPSYRF